MRATTRQLATPKTANPAWPRKSTFPGCGTMSCASCSCAATRNCLSPINWLLRWWSGPKQWNSASPMQKGRRPRPPLAWIRRPFRNGPGASTRCRQWSICCRGIRPGAETFTSGTNSAKRRSGLPGCCSIWARLARTGNGTLNTLRRLTEALDRLTGREMMVRDME